MAVTDDGLYTGIWQPSIPRQRPGRRLHAGSSSDGRCSGGGAWPSVGNGAANSGQLLGGARLLPWHNAR